MSDELEFELNEVQRKGLSNLGRVYVLLERVVSSGVFGNLRVQFDSEVFDRKYVARRVAESGYPRLEDWLEASPKGKRLFLFRVERV